MHGRMAPWSSSAVHCGGLGEVAVIANVAKVIERAVGGGSNSRVARW